MPLTSPGLEPGRPGAVAEPGSTMGVDPRDRTPKSASQSGHEVQRRSLDPARWERKGRRCEHSGVERRDLDSAICCARLVAANAFDYLSGLLSREGTLNESGGALVSTTRRPPRVGIR